MLPPKDPVEVTDPLPRPEETEQEASHSHPWSRDRSGLFDPPVELAVRDTQHHGYSPPALKLII